MKIHDRFHDRKTKPGPLLRSGNKNVTFASLSPRLLPTYIPSPGANPRLPD
jgi:hypothetical protein